MARIISSRKKYVPVKDLTVYPSKTETIEVIPDDKHIIGIYIGREKSGYTVTILNHPTLTPGTVTTYSLINNVRLFKGTITISNG